MKRFGQNLRDATIGHRTPRAGEWKASDFDDSELEAWDREEQVPFDLPPNPDDPFDRRYDDSRRAPAQPRGSARRRYADDEAEWNAGWETGTWDTGWATNAQASMEYARASGEDDYQDEGFWSPGRGQAYASGEEDALARSLGTLARLGAVGPSIGRIARVRLLLHQRPAAAALLAFFLLGFVLTACAPLVPLLRLGYDTADAASRVSKLQSLMAGGSSALLNTNSLNDAQTQVDAIQRDLYEINGAMNVLGAPFGAVSPTIRNYQFLIHMGYELTTAGDEGLGVARTLLTPFEGGALAADGSPGITPADMQQARNLLSDAETHISNAVAIEQNIDPNALPSQLRPGTRIGSMLAQLPAVPKLFGEIKTLLDVAPNLLGIGQPANYLVLAMDRTELRPGGGFTGNYGILEVDGGKQSAQHPLALQDIYKLDTQYYSQFPSNACAGAGLSYVGPQPPNYYWWWPVRCASTTLGWGVRDANLSANFPTNAATAMQIAQDTKGTLPNGAPIQGVVSFTPVLIADLIQATGGSLRMPTYNVTVTPDNLERTIHEYQLGPKETDSANRKQFTHDLSSALLAEIKHLPKSQLKGIFSVAVQALKTKDLQVYFADPRAELILRQLGLASEVSSGNGDGFFVVDANDGGNKANQFVTEHQTDLVTLLPNGGAIHQLQIAVTYNKTGDIFNPGSFFDAYSEVQRTYLPGDATILGYSGYPTDTFTIPGCPGSYATPETDCTPGHALHGPNTLSDVAGRTMVMGALLVPCGYASSPGAYSTESDTPVCRSNPQSHTAYVYISWYTPHAFTIDKSGHGTYSELIEKQAGTTLNLPNNKQGSLDSATVYISTAQLHAQQPNPDNNTPGWVIQSSNELSPSPQYNRLLQGATKVFDGPIIDNTQTPAYNF